MTIMNVTRNGDWKEVYQLALKTVGKETVHEPSNEWKRSILKAEHSPIRAITFTWTWVIPYYVSVHFSRHKVGIEHYVRTQRSDRTGVARDKLPQDTLVEHTCVANAQALINISRKRLCFNASKETQRAWVMLQGKILDIDPIIGEAMVPECVYRGFCPEIHSCEFCKTDVYSSLVEEYRN